MTDSRELTEWRDRASRFKDAFGKLLMDRDTLEECGHLASFLANRYWQERIVTLKKVDARSDLTGIKACVEFLAKSAILELVEGQPSVAADLRNALLNLRKAATAPALNALSAELEEAIAGVPETGNINWHAAYAVDSLRALWFVIHGKPAPMKGLNPASDFARFLEAGFQFLGLEAKAIPAFRRWAKMGFETEADWKK